MITKELCQKFLDSKICTWNDYEDERIDVDMDICVDVMNELEKERSEPMESLVTYLSQEKPLKKKRRTSHTVFFSFLYLFHHSIIYGKVC